MPLAHFFQTLLARGPVTSRRKPFASLASLRVNASCHDGPDCVEPLAPV